MVALLARALAACWLLRGAAAVAHERFAAVEADGVMLSPRQYHVHPAQPLGKRQDVCNPGYHPCNEIGPAGASLCCPNDQYCIINPTATTSAGCCQLGSTCHSPCNETHFQCNSTSTLTLTLGPSSATTTTTSVSVGPACCARNCTGTPPMFRCASSFGGGCCAYGSKCAPTNQCLFTPAPTTTAASVTMAAPGCATGQITCPASLGGGCCAATQRCTLLVLSSSAGDGGGGGGVARCAEVTAPPPPTGSGVAVVDVGDSSGLSAGGKAGVAVGVVVGCGLVIGAVTWCCVRRRRRRSEGEEGSGGDGGGGGGDAGGGGNSSRRSRATGVIGRVVGGGGGGGGGREMSDENSDMLSRSGVGGAGRPGPLEDYFGPDAAIGPYSDTQSGASPVTTPGLERERGGVPVQPHEPGDIAVPVEIDSRLRRPQPQRAPDSSSTHPVSDAVHEEAYELYGSDPVQVSPYLPSPPDERPR